MVREQLLLRIVGEGPTLQSRDDAVRGVVDVIHLDGLLLAAGREDGRLVHQVLQVGAAHPGAALGDLADADLLVELLVPQVHVEDLLPPLHVGQVDLHAAVEPPGAQEGAVEDVRAVGGRDDDDAAVALEPVHLGQDLVQGLLPLVVPAAHAGAALPADGVDLVDEHDARGVLLRLLEDVANPRGTHAHEELDELCGRRLDERDPGLACQCFGHERLARARRTSE
mmetsp:Transcript_105965/g.276713  ORF Transcript_105965/g.276713 Transcript_105965/m.276713 type:complete len:225 (+) Transcript_105965:1169-1843(+)